MDKSSDMVLVRESALPDIIIKVLHAKELIAASQQLSSSEACRIVGISRSAYYKYKDCVFRYEEYSSKNVFSINLLLRDKQGVLSAVISRLYGLGMNIIKINQDPPVDSVAAVSLSVRNDGEAVCDKATLVDILGRIDGALDVKIAAGAVI